MGSCVFVQEVVRQGGTTGRGRKEFSHPGKDPLFADLPGRHTNLLWTKGLLGDHSAWLGEQRTYV